MTPAGKVRLARVYFRCSACTLGSFALDERLGIEGRYSPHVQRLICLAAASWSFDVASQRLAELCGVSVSNSSVRQIAQQHGAAMLSWQRDDPEAVRDFREADGDVEFTTDGTSVNTTDGWREMKVGIFSKRHPGQPATPEEWSTRTLPKPHTRLCFAAIEKSERFGSRWRAWRKRLGLGDASPVTVLADGAKWIWEEQRKHLTHADGVLDIFHVLEHVAATAKALYGETQHATDWTDAGREALLAQGFAGIERCITEGLSRTRSPAKRSALQSLQGYLQTHENHLDYYQRLAAGKSIGSGQVEGACKNLIGRRLKQTGARWRPRRVNRMTGLCSLLYSSQWTAYWSQTGA